jgi:hypothetical protein
MTTAFKAIVVFVAVASYFTVNTAVKCDINIDDS